jgi:hypothetical protein
MDRTLVRLSSKSGSIAGSADYREIRATGGRAVAQTDNSVDIPDRYDNQRRRGSTAARSSSRAPIAGSRSSRDTRRPTRMARSVSNI